MSSSHDIDLGPFIRALKDTKNEYNIEFVLRKLLQEYSSTPQQPQPNRKSTKRKLEEEEQDEDEFNGYAPKDADQEEDELQEVDDTF